LSQRAKPFVPATTMSRHGFSIVPNLTRGLVPTGLDQIWVAASTISDALAFYYGASK
jgi:putative transposase